MTRIKTLVALVLLGLLTTCSNEVNIFTPEGSIPVAYCLLNPQTNIQQVRLAKTYTPNRETYLNDPVADSTLWNRPVEIYVEKYNDQDDVEEVFYFEPITYDDKESGLFPANSFHLFQSNFTPESGKRYAIYIFFPETKQIISGQSIIMTVPDVVDPLAIPNRMITLDSLSSFFVRWKPAMDGGLYKGIFRFHFVEELADQQELKWVDLKTPIYAELQDEYVYEKALNPNNFFLQLKKELEVKEGLGRKPIGMEYLFYSMGHDAALQYHTGNKGENDFTSIFEYTNLVGGIGIFSSWIYQRIPNIPLSPVSIRNLKTHPATKDLGFTDN